MEYSGGLLDRVYKVSLGFSSQVGKYLDEGRKEPYINTKWGLFLEGTGLFKARVNHYGSPDVIIEEVSTGLTIGVECKVGLRFSPKELLGQGLLNGHTGQIIWGDVVSRDLDKVGEIPTYIVGGVVLAKKPKTLTTTTITKLMVLRAFVEEARSQKVPGFEKILAERQDYITIKGSTLGNKFKRVNRACDFTGGRFTQEFGFLTMKAWQSLSTSFRLGFKEDLERLVARYLVECTFRGETLALNEGECGFVRYESSRSTGLPRSSYLEEWGRFTTYILGEDWRSLASA